MIRRIFIILFAVSSIKIALALNNSFRNSKIVKLKSSINKLLTTLSISATFFTQIPYSNALPTSTPGSLEENIVKLESSGNRADLVQNLADLYEISGSETPRARAKYKYRIINAINQKHIEFSNDWDKVLSYESGELKRRVDPFRTVDLKDYLKIAPVVGGVCYLGALFVQQALPELFVFAYPFGAFIFAAPIIYIIVLT